MPASEGLRGGPLVSFDSKYLIVPSGDISYPLDRQGHVRVYELSTLKSVGEPLNLPGMNMCLAIGATGQILTAYETGRPSTLQLWELATGKPIGNPWTVNSLVRQIIFKPGDKQALN